MCEATDVHGGFRACLRIEELPHWYQYLHFVQYVAYIDVLFLHPLGSSSLLEYVLGSSLNLCIGWWWSLARAEASRRSFQLTCN